MNDRFVLVLLVVLERIVGAKFIGVDDQRLLLDDHEKESYGRFVDRLRGDNALLVAAAINEREHRWFVSGVASSTTFREPTRARPRAALAAFQRCSNADLVDLDRDNEIERRRVEQFARTLDAPAKWPVQNVNCSV